MCGRCALRVFCLGGFFLSSFRLYSSSWLVVTECKYLCVSIASLATVIAAFTS